MVSFVRRSIGLGLMACAVACHRLPDTIPYEAIVSEKEKDPLTATYRITELSGSELFLDGKPLGKLKPGSAKVSIEVEWSGPKAEVRKVMNGTFTIGVTGACGSATLPVEGPPANWKAMSDGQLAKAMSYDKKLPVFLDVKMPKTFPVYVDWGNARGTLLVGTTKVPPGTNKVPVVVEGCKSGLSVTLDGAPLGTIDLSAKGALVTLEPGVCHAHEEVGYGNQQATKPTVYFPAKPVLPMAEVPSYFLESAPSSVNLYAGTKGTLTSELLRARCR